jgi:hypothetical protein
MESSYIRPKYPEYYRKGDTFMHVRRGPLRHKSFGDFESHPFGRQRRVISKEYVANMIYKFSYRKKGFFSSVRSTIELMRLEVPLRKMSTNRVGGLGKILGTGEV